MPEESPDDRAAVQASDRPGRPLGWRHWVATLGGAGLLPAVPGTWGSLVAMLPLFVLPAGTYPYFLLGGALAATLLCPPLARSLGIGEKNGRGDPGWFVLDEAAGMWIAALAPSRPAAGHLVMAFLLFRAFDMMKPPPLRRLERIGRGWGVVLDDLFAGMYALALTMILAPLLVAQ